MKKRTFSVDFKSDVFQVKKVVSDALDFLNGVFTELTKDMIFELRLIISEALLNAVTHGNNRDTRKSVSLIIKAYEDYSILIQIKDEGKGFDRSSVLEVESNDESLMLECGRGIKLLYQLSDEVSYNERGNTVRIYKKVIV